MPIGWHAARWEGSTEGTHCSQQRTWQHLKEAKQQPGADPALPCRMITVQEGDVSVKNVFLLEGLQSYSILLNARAGRWIVLIKL